MPLSLAFEQEPERPRHAQPVVPGHLSPVDLIHQQERSIPFHGERDGRSLACVEVHEELPQERPIERRGDNERLGAVCISPRAEHVLPAVQLVGHLLRDDHTSEQAPEQR